MPRSGVSLVDILREFLEALELLDALAERYASNELVFSELEEFVGDDEGSVLFRLKEKCHALFRSDAEGAAVARPREALFDLAVGSLFHEAMKFREDFYQREVYAPRVRALRMEAGAEADPLFQEFERILSTVSTRLEEGLLETRSLMDRSWDQLRVLVSERPYDGFATRFLIERKSTLERCCAPGLDSLLAQIYGDSAAGYVLAGRSYLASGHYDAACGAFKAALSGGAEQDDIPSLCAFAYGMAAYLGGEYDECVAQLAEWADAACAAESAHTNLARAAVSKIGQFVDDSGRDSLVAASSKLLEKLGSASQ